MDQVARPLSGRMKEWTLAATLVWVKIRSSLEVDRLCPYGRIDIHRMGSWYNDHITTWRGGLRPELFAGTLVASASVWKNGEKRGDPETIKPSIWRDAELAYYHDEKFFEVYVRVPAALKERGQLSFELREITFQRTDVQNCLPSTPQQSRSYDDLAASQFVSLVDAKEWIICRGETIPYEVYEEVEQAKERELFDKINGAIKSEKGLKVFGIEEDAPNRQETVLPTGIWEKMNKAPGYAPSFTEITFNDNPGPDEPRVTRHGTIHLEDETYNFVNLPSSFVLETWPPVTVPPPTTLSLAAEYRARTSKDVDDAIERATKLFHEERAKNSNGRIASRKFVELCGLKGISSTIAKPLHSSLIQGLWGQGRPGKN